MTNNYLALQGLILERGITQGALAKAIGLTPTAFSLKLNRKCDFTISEINNICKYLSIKKEDIHIYFFSDKVQWEDEKD